MLPRHAIVRNGGDWEATYVPSGQWDVHFGSLQRPRDSISSEREISVWVFEGIVLMSEWSS